MLASDLIPRLRELGFDLVLSDRVKKTSDIVELDITDTLAVKELVQEIEPDWIVNCAAYTQVDKAEEEKELAFKINGRGPGNLAKAAKLVSARLLHVSTDYVFGGEGQDRITPYTEDDPMHPCGVYGQSKRYGDELVSTILGDKALIVRPSWLHGVNGPNFLDTMLRLGQQFSEEKKELKVVGDQVGSPTHTAWLAEVICKLIVKDASGVFNVTSSGSVSWFDFAREIFDQTQLEVQVSTQTTKELGRPAPRPAFSKLSTEKLEEFLGEKCITWKESIAQHIEARRDS